MKNYLKLKTGRKKKPTAQKEEKKLI